LELIDITKSEWEMISNFTLTVCSSWLAGCVVTPSCTDVTLPRRPNVFLNYVGFLCAE